MPLTLASGLAGEGQQASVGQSLGGAPRDPLHLGSTAGAQGMGAGTRPSPNSGMKGVQGGGRAGCRVRRVMVVLGAHVAGCVGRWCEGRHAAARCGRATPHGDTGGHGAVAGLTGHQPAVRRTGHAEPIAVDGGGRWLFGDGHTSPPGCPRSHQTPPDPADGSPTARSPLRGGTLC